MSKTSITLVDNFYDSRMGDHVKGEPLFATLDFTSDTFKIGCNYADYVNIVLDWEALKVLYLFLRDCEGDILGETD